MGGNAKTRVPVRITPKSNHQWPQNRKLNPTQPVNQQIYRILRRDTVHRPIPSCTPPSEKEVSVRFAVSRQLVRGSWLLAETDSSICPQRGSYVNKIIVAGA